MSLKTHMDKLAVTQERHYSAHNALLRVADNFLFAAENQERFCSEGDFVALVMSALAIESLCNTVSALIFADWKDYESASPRAKIRLICSELNIPYKKDSEPFKGMHWLINFRNKIAHAKPEPLHKRSEMTREEYQQLQSSGGPQSEIENMITIDSARCALKSVQQFEDMIGEKLPEDKKYLVSADSWEMSAEGSGGQLTIR